jgi:hypothetical protein
MEARPSHQFAYNLSAEKSSDAKLQELPEMSDMVEQLKSDSCGFHKTKRQDLLDPRAIGYFDDTFGITGVTPVFVDHSGMVVWFLDSRGIMFQWDEMEQIMTYLGNNLREGLANYLYHQENMCAILEDSGNLIPLEKLEQESTQRAKEMLSKAVPLTESTESMASNNKRSKRLKKK